VAGLPEKKYKGSRELLLEGDPIANSFTRGRENEDEKDCELNLEGGVREAIFR